MLVAITEGGETSSVLGTVSEALDRGSVAFLMFNNPADILCRHIERSRKHIEDPRVTVLDLFCGSMAIAGSTRMQATTSELLVAGAALEKILTAILKEEPAAKNTAFDSSGDIDYTSAFADLLNDLASQKNAAEIARYLELEKKIYSDHGLVTYYANEYLLDLFTDTTERAPTFMLPPFRKSDDLLSQPSWAFVKNPMLPTPAAWEKVLGRTSRCLQWDSTLYAKMDAPARVVENPPALNQNELFKFLIGQETDSSRFAQKPNVAVSVNSAREIATAAHADFMDAFQQAGKNFSQQTSLLIGRSTGGADYRINCQPKGTVLHLLDRLAVKLTMNTISTGTMVMMGRVSSNWMTWVEVTNKKLRDRAIRLISEMCKTDYRSACFALHETIEEMQNQDYSGRERPSPVQVTIEKYISGSILHVKNKKETEQ
jgi:N-acetylmuramic acid 6-phosphate etherase